MKPKDRPATATFAAEIAEKIAAELAASDCEPIEATGGASAGRWRVEVRVAPVDEFPEWLTPCMRDICRALKGLDHRVTTSELLEILEHRERAGKAQAHGESTIRLALAHLAREGVLSANHCAPYGYLLQPPYDR